jgi:hypothetical protein
VTELIASGIAPSGPDRFTAEIGQRLSFHMSLVSGNASLFAAPPHLDPATGNLSFSLVPNANGISTWDVVLIDDGGAEKRAHTRGQNVSEAKRLVVDVISVNDPPSFSYKPNIIIFAYSNTSSLSEAGVVFDWRAGPPDEEATQHLTFSVQTFPLPQASVWISKPTINTVDGSLSLQIDSSVPFETVLTITLQDDGSILHGGRNTVSHNVTMWFVPRPQPVVNLAIFQRTEKQLDVKWAHADVTRSASDPARIVLFDLELSKDCSAYTTLPAEMVNCSLFKRRITIGISQCATDACNASFSLLETTVRYVVSVEAHNRAGASTARRLGAIVFGPPSSPTSAAITQMATYMLRRSLLILDWDK